MAMACFWHCNVQPVTCYLGNGWPLGISLMDVLQKLFEKHFHSPVEQVQPLQGELGGSGRKIIRLAGGRSTAMVCRCRRFMARTWAMALIWKKTSATPRCLSFSPRIVKAKALLCRP